MLKLKNISKYYHSNDVVAMGLRKVNLEFELGEFIAVTGESGSGKSTLLNVISGLDTYEDGEMYVAGEETSYFSVADWETYRRQYIGFVFQNYNIIDSYSVYENVMIALKIQGYDAKTRKERAIELIKKVGLESHLHHKASKLSGGQKQRAVIARALAKDCPIIVADEPTGNLDTESSSTILALLKEISKDKLVIVVTHNYEEVAEYATRRIRLFDGEVVEDKKIAKYEKAKEHTKIQSYVMSTWGLLTFSFRNLFRTPRRTIFQTVVFVFIVLVFTLTYGFFVRLISEAGGSNYNSIFNNVTDKRIIITKEDKTAFTQLELDDLSDIDRVLALLEHDVVNDSIITHYYLSGEADYQWLNTTPYYLNAAITLKKSDLLEGDLPSNRTEVIVEASMGLELGDKVNLSSSEYLDYREDNLDQVLSEQTEEFTVVGIVPTLRPFEWRGMMYFHLDYLNDPLVVSTAYFSRWGNSPYTFSGTIEVDDSTRRIETQYYEYILVDTLAPNEIIASEGMFYNLMWPITEVDPSFDFEANPDFYTDYPITFESSSTFSTTTVVLNIIDILYYETDSVEISELIGGENTWMDFIAINPDTYYSFFDTDVYQPSVYVNNRYDALKVIDDIEDLGYNAIYPESIEDPFSALTRIILTVVFGFLMVILLVVMYFITFLVLRNIQEAKKKDFLIFRSIGASKASLNRVTIFELLTLTVVSVVIVFTLIELNAMFAWIRQIANILTFFTIGNYLFLFFILFVLSFLLGRRFNSRIFNSSVITSLKSE